MLSFAILSDLHFSNPTFHFTDFLSKKWLGNLNALLFRTHLYSEKTLESLPSLWNSLHVQYLLVTGDLSSTSSEKEFLQAKQFFASVEKLGITPIFLPGNHDSYTKNASDQQLFYQYFPSHPTFGSLETEKVAVYSLQEKIFLITFDVVRPTSWISSRGNFSPSIEKNLRKHLESLPQDAIFLFSSHYPILQESSFRKNLTRKEALLSLLKEFPQKKIYIHGHTHNHFIKDLRKKNLPIIIGTGSVCHTKKGNWTLLQMDSTSLSVASFVWKKPMWHNHSNLSFHL